ncbi:hypothetical protein FUT87_19825 [Mitsuaria sp. TWR114]|nr:hypothetical protein FUT87_19825 [Mitsuaria sp. TWR114]
MASAEVLALPCPLTRPPSRLACAEPEAFALPLACAPWARSGEDGVEGDAGEEGEGVEVVEGVEVEPVPLVAAAVPSALT